MVTTQEIWQAFVDESGWPRMPPPSRRQTEEWLQYPSLEIRGPLFHFLVEGTNGYIVDPAFSDKELFPFVSRYFEDCLSSEDEPIQESRWILSGFDLGHSIARWALGVWQSQSVSTLYRKRLAEWLRAALIKFPRQQKPLTTALRDHFFSSSKQIRKQFASWHEDPHLALLFPELSEISNR